MSVVIPTRDRWSLLSRALGSVLGQEGVELEVLVVDDGSTDETPARLAAMEDPRVRVLRQSINQGVARARNRGIAEARGEWVAFLDDDDFWAPTCLREHLESIVDAGASWGYGASISVDRNGARRIMLPAPPEQLAAGILDLNVAGPPSSATVRRDLLEEVGCFDDQLSVIADWDLWVRLSRHGDAARCEKPLVAYWEHEAAMHHQDRGDLDDELAYMADKYSGLLPAGRRFGARAAARKRAADYRLAGRRMRAAAAYLRIGFSEPSRTDLLRGVALLGGEGLVARLKIMARPDVPTPEWVARAIGKPAEPVRAPSALGGSLEVA